MTDHDAPLIDIFRRHFRPLQPEPTGVAPRLDPVTPAGTAPGKDATAEAALGQAVSANRGPSVRAVMFDLYGTLLISGSGEVGTTREAASRAALEGALEAMDVPTTGPLDDAIELMQRRIREEHAERQAQGVAYPEIQIADVWRWVLSELLARGGLPADAAPHLERLDYRRLSVEYEARANPCWPMPGLVECLARLGERGFPLGLVSNAQFYTPLLFPALVDRDLERCGFDRRLCVFSFEHGVAKPGTQIYRLAIEALARRDIGPAETLYVGNDMLNDIMPAAALGFRTALFAGDARSLRWRADDDRVAGVQADLVVTDLAQLLSCSMIERREAGG